MRKTIGITLFVIYSIIAIIVTILLLSFNDYNCSEIGNYTICILKDDSLEPEYKQGSILIVKSTNDKHINEGDKLLFYKVINSTEYEIVERELEYKTNQGRHIIYNVNEEEMYDTSFLIGKVDNTTIIEGPWGTILLILESRWGYLFCIVIVSLLLFLQELLNLIVEIKYAKAEAKKENQKIAEKENLNKEKIEKEQ